MAPIKVIEIALTAATSDHADRLAAQNGETPADLLARLITGLLAVMEPPSAAGSPNVNAH